VVLHHLPYCPLPLDDKSAGSQPPLQGRQGLIKFDGFEVIIHGGWSIQ